MTARPSGSKAEAGARAAILDRIRTAFPDPRPVDVPRTYRRTAHDQGDVVALFAERVADYRATVAVVSEAELPDAVARVLARHGTRRIVVPAGLPATILATATGIERHTDEPPLSHAQLDAVDSVVTGCAVAIAETGTIVLDGSADQGRRALSLLPDHHLCIVASDAIVGSVAEALPRLDPRRPLTWISGPSATSDIELQRIEGVHGPRNLDVLIVRNG